MTNGRGFKSDGPERMPNEKWAASDHFPVRAKARRENGTHQVMTRCSYGEVKYSKVPFSLDGTCFGAAPRLFEVRM